MPAGALCHAHRQKRVEVRLAAGSESAVDQRGICPRCDGQLHAARSRWSSRTRRPLRSSPCPCLPKGHVIPQATNPLLGPEPKRPGSLRAVVEYQRTKMQSGRATTKDRLGVHNWQLHESNPCSSKDQYTFRTLPLCGYCLKSALVDSKECLLSAGGADVPFSGMSAPFSLKRGAYITTKGVVTYAPPATVTFVVPTFRSASGVLT